jgi:hypothetical protein
VLDTESSVFKYFWIPAFAGMTVKRTFYEAIKVDEAAWRFGAALWR